MKGLSFCWAADREADIFEPAGGAGELSGPAAGVDDLPGIGSETGGLSPTRLSRLVSLATSTSSNDHSRLQ